VTQREELAALPLSERIATLIGAAETDQEGLAATLGTPRETVNRWLNHHARPGRENRQKLATYASEIYGETIGPDLFREYVTDRPRPDEAVLLEVRDTLADLAGLLAEQRELVGEMSRLVAVLTQRAAAIEGGGGQE